MLDRVVRPAPTRRAGVGGSGVLALIAWVALPAAAWAQHALPAPSGYAPHVEAASEDGARAMSAMEIPEGFDLSLWAAEPLLANIVAFHVDAQGDVYVAETFRLHAGVTDIRSHMDWLEDELATFSVADRLAMMRKFEGDALTAYSTEHDRVRLVRDTDGDGAGDTATVFADGFNAPEDGLGSGVLSYRGDVWFTNIPDLWRLRDRDGDGHADEQVSFAHGFGVRVTLLGHDLHGLRIGPDGYLYYSMGDRGFVVTSREGQRFEYPETGAVLRSELDGSHLEVVHSGLRNPQELAFNDFGDLFTGDNNSDGGDQARLVHVVWGGESGWRSPYQWPSDRGPWGRAPLWKPHFPGQPAYIVPPIDNLAHGPSGFTHYPGTGLPAKYDDHFFLADFRGGRSSSGVHTFPLERAGASFELGEVERFIWNTLVTDVDFGPDGAFYFSDWVEGWGMTGKGRLYRLADPDAQRDPVVADVRRLLGGGIARQQVVTLAALLSHLDRRVRTEAQFELVRRGSEGLAALVVTARGAPDQIARVHATWGLGQAGRTDPRQLSWLLELALDGDVEVASQALRGLGDARHRGADAVVLIGLRHADARVRFFAARAAARIGIPASVPLLADVVRRVGDSDLDLRHMAVMGLAACALPSELATLARDASAEVRLAVALVWRRLADPALARLLDDPDPRVANEAAWAIYDTLVLGALPALADRVSGAELRSDAFARRALAAAHRVGGETRARDLLGYASREDVPSGLRLFALQLLADWDEPSGVDVVHGAWRPIGPRTSPWMAALVEGRAADAIDLARWRSEDAEDGRAAEAAADASAGSRRERDRIVAVWLRLAGSSGAHGLAEELRHWVEAEDAPASLRTAALAGLEDLAPADLASIVGRALSDVDGGLRAAGLQVLERLSPGEALPRVPAVLENGEWAEQRVAYRILGAADSPEADAILAGQLDLLLADLVPAELSLDLVLAAEQREDAGVRQRLDEHLARRDLDGELGPWLDALVGGDAGVGYDVFQRVSLSCVRCHAVELDAEPRVGPNLAGVGRRLARLQILESLVAPNRRTAPGYAGTNVFLHGGDLLTGRLVDETDAALTLQDADGKVHVVDRADIELVRPGLSAMPEGLAATLTRQEMRDLVAYVAGL